MRKVLVIEDNPDNMTLITDILEMNEHEVFMSETGFGGIEKAREIKPDYIVLDIQLPDIDGFHVLEELKKNEETRNIPVIAMTSYAMAGDREHLLSAGCSGYVEKPIEPGRVMQQIESFLGGNE